MTSSRNPYKAVAQAMRSRDPNASYHYCAGSLQSLGSPEVAGPTMQVVLRTKKQAGHQGGPLPTQSISSPSFTLGLPDLACALVFYQLPTGSCNLFKSQKNEGDVGPKTSLGPDTTGGRLSRKGT